MVKNLHLEYSNKSTAVSRHNQAITLALVNRVTYDGRIT
jgi:hypothetical protein